MGAFLTVLTATVLSFAGSAASRQLVEQSSAVPRATPVTTGLIKIVESGGDVAKAVHTHNPFGGGDYFLKKFVGKSEVLVHIDFPPGFDDTQIDKDTFFKITVDGLPFESGLLGIFFRDIDISKHKATLEVNGDQSSVAWNKKGIGFKFSKFLDSSKVYSEHDSTTHLHGDLILNFTLLPKLYENHKTASGDGSSKVELFLNDYKADVILSWSYVAKSKVVEDKEIGSKEETSVKVSGTSPKVK